MIRERTGPGIVNAPANKGQILKAKRLEAKPIRSGRILKILLILSA